MADIVLEMDESLQILDHEEQRELTGAKEKLKQRVDARESLRKDYVKRRHVVREKKLADAGVAAPKAKGKARKTGKSAKQSYFPKYPDLPAGMLTQSDAKALMPPHSFIWRSRTQGAWCCHVRGYSRRSFSWNLYGDRDSVFHCLKVAWGMHLAREGLTMSACPVEGLFSREDATESAA